MPNKMTHFLLFKIKIKAKKNQLHDILFGLMKIKNVFNYYSLLTFSRQKSSQTRNALNCTRCPTLIKITSLASIYQVINWYQNKMHQCNWSKKRLQLRMHFGLVSFVIISKKGKGSVVFPDYFSKNKFFFEMIKKTSNSKSLHM